MVYDGHDPAAKGTAAFQLREQQKAMKAIMAQVNEMMQAKEAARKKKEQEAAAAAEKARAEAAEAEWKRGKNKSRLNN